MVFLITHIYLIIGVKAIKRLFSGLLLIGAGDGTVELVEEVAGKSVESVLKLPSTPALQPVRNLFLYKNHYNNICSFN